MLLSIAFAHNGGGERPTSLLSSIIASGAWVASTIFGKDSFVECHGARLCLFASELFFPDLGRDCFLFYFFVGFELCFWAVLGF